MTEDALVLGGRYEVGPLLGRGGMAEVRRAHDTRLGRDVAIKRLRADLAGDPMFQARFKREAQAAAGLNHPNIVSVYDTGTQHDDTHGVDIPYIVMELVEGSTLRDILREGRRILPERAFELAGGVLDALAYSHKAGIVHRDIKPANVMLTKTGQVKVMDFGIARAVADTQATMTQTAAVIGTAQYLSPEQARGETVDARSDVYSAGCLLYELLTGRPPFVGDSPVSVAYQHVREVPAPPSQAGDGDPSITPEMDAVVLKSLAKDPADRYQSAGQMREDIDRLLNHQPVGAVIPAAFLPGAAPVAQGSADPTMLLGAVSDATEGTGSTAARRAASPVSPVPAAAASADDAPVPVATQTAATTKKRSPWMGILVTLLVLALIAGLGYLGFRWWQGQHEVAQTTQVPAVIGYSEDAAKSSLQNAKLTPVVKYVEDNKATAEGVTAQDPTGGSVVAVNSNVTITVVKIPNKLTIPQLKGKTEKEARSALVNAGFKDANISTQDSDTDTPEYSKGQVTAVSPGEGTQGNADTHIVLTLATGHVTVPNVIGEKEGDARSALENKGLAVTVRYQESTATEGTVISQDKPGNSKLDKGSAVTITVAKAPSPQPSATPTVGNPTQTATASAPAPTGKKSN